MYQGTLLSQKHQREDKLSKGECISLNKQWRLTVNVYTTSDKLAHS
jgi:hypothetical protein